MLGVAFVVPAAYFTFRGAINGALAKRLGLLFTMGGTQVCLIAFVCFVLSENDVSHAVSVPLPACCPAACC